MQAFTPTCITRKVIKNKPVSAITTFFPIEEVKNFPQVIERCEFDFGCKFRAQTPKRRKFLVSCFLFLVHYAIEMFEISDVFLPHRHIGHIVHIDSVIIEISIE